MIEELQNKDVISIENGCRIGYVCDVEAEVCSGNIKAIIVCQQPAGFPFRRCESYRISWCDIVVMGEETILVKNASVCTPKASSVRGFFNIFSK